MKNKASFMSDQQAQLYTLSLSDFLCFLLLMEARKDKGEPSPASPAAAADSKPPKPAKKRKPNANGPCKTSPAWDHFTMIPDNEVDEPTAACKYCGKRYLYNQKVHGTSNMLSHMKIFPKYPYALKSDPTQQVLEFQPKKDG